MHDCGDRDGKKGHCHGHHGKDRNERKWISCRPRGEDYHKKMKESDSKCPFANYTPDELVDAWTNKCLPAFFENVGESFKDMTQNTQYWAKEAENFFEMGREFFEKTKKDWFKGY